MNLQFAIFVCFIAIAFATILLASRHRHSNLDGLIHELCRFDQERLALLARAWQGTSEELNVTRRDLLSTVGGPLGFLNMRRNAAVMIAMLKFFPDPLDGERDDELPELITDITRRAILVRSRAGAAILESLALPLFKFPFHGMQAISEYHELVNRFYQVVTITEPRMVERLEFVL